MGAVHVFHSLDFLLDVFFWQVGQAQQIPADVVGTPEI